MINIQLEILNEHPGDSFNSNSTSGNSFSIIVTSPPTKQQHDDYRKQSRNELNISDHQTETVVSNPHDLNSMLTKQNASNDLKQDIPTFIHKQLINAYIEKKADEIFIPFTNQIETLIKSYEIFCFLKKCVSRKKKH